MNTPITLFSLIGSLLTVSSVTLATPPSLLELETVEEERAPLRVEAIETVAPALREANLTVLKLNYQEAESTVGSVKFKACVLTPLASDAECTYRVLVDGVEVEAPQRILHEIDLQRAKFNRESATGGITRGRFQTECDDGADAQGWILETSYLTVDENTGEPLGFIDQSVFTKSSNCQYSLLIAPNSQTAREEARSVMDKLDTIRGYALDAQAVTTEQDDQAEDEIHSDTDL